MPELMLTRQTRRHAGVIADRTTAEPQLFDALEGLMAFDLLGAPHRPSADTEGGELRRQVARRLQTLPQDEARVTLGRFARERLLGERALAEGRGLADVATFILWLGEFDIYPDDP